MSPRKPKPNKRFASTLSLYVILTGWVGALTYSGILLEHYSFQELFNHFLSSEQKGIRFRAFIFFAPLLATIVGYLIHEREKFLRDLLTKKQELDNTNEQLELMIKQKDLFIIRLGHDLKTPLTPLVALLPLINKQEKDLRLKKLLDVAVVNVNTLKELVIKSLKLAKVKSSRELMLEDVDLKQEVDSYIHKRDLLLNEKNIKINNTIESAIMVRVDKVDLEELFYNLISNAIKYSPMSSDILIEAMVEGRVVSISVLDSGIGLTREQLNHIFDEFYKADESRHKLDSSGLGLSICKNIVRNHGGDIQATSEGLGKGTKISFILPLMEV
jgi:signal transduction histidine kinase